MSTSTHPIPPAEHVLARFTEPTQQWFRGAFAGPTPAQLGAWDVISTGGHALVVAPTGSGKTLAAFLWALDSFIRPTETAPPPGTRVLYISPLKALGVDVERNLRSPLIGITQTARRLGIDVPNVTVGVRSGDTTARDRRRLVTDPPDILITTPESLYLMLTSQARSALKTVDTVIIDEVHAVAGDKRGAHLALSLERLDAFLGTRAQRVGLSATVEPAEEVARFIGGTQPVTVVNPPAEKSWDLHVSVPVEDMTDLPAATAELTQHPGPQFGDGVSGPGLQPHASLWPHVEEKIVDLISAHRSTLVFANSRRLAERLTGRLNDIWQARQESQPVETTSAEDDDDAAPVQDFARAHHGSVSKEQRALVEDALKSGRLRCVVATSSLELGIDMGSVDVVIQVESPPSVASGLQRVGRAGHQVGQTSVGWFFPKHRGDLVNTTVVVERMLTGQIESLRIPTNPLDILAQHTVAAVALDDWDSETWFDLVRRSAPFASLPHSVYHTVLDLLAGRYPSDEFAALRPRLVWDREEGTLSGRPGAQRLAVTSGGTIPDRGMFGVFLAGSDTETGTSAGGTTQQGPRRVGELDEEMVYESRVGDVIVLGATSWQIQDITHDRVLVIPAFGQPGRLPFWRGDALGRPVELGTAIGAFRREIHTGDDAAQARLATAGLDDYARTNLLNYLAAQTEATGELPTERTIVVERFHDELGDWRVVLHSPYGMSVHAPWALAVGARLRARYGMDGQAMAADDGIVLRVPLMDDEPPGAELFLFDDDELEELVSTEVGSSALFAARFRENAARALLLPRRDPGQRTPLWQQRQRSAQLLEVARKYPQFPMILETVRECLQEVYDLPSLRRISRQIESRQLRLVESTTQSPSPFAQSLLFGYTAQFMYEGDSPLAERRAAALALDPGLLNELLGRTELRDLLDADIIHQVEQQLQRLSPDRHARGLEGTADLLRLLGPLTTDELNARLDTTDQHPDQVSQWAEELVRHNRALSVRVAGHHVYAAIEDAARLRDALGVALPMGVPTTFVEPVEDPLGDLVSRYARTHGPFTAADVADRLGLGVAVVFHTLQRLAEQQRVTSGAFRPQESRPATLDTPADSPSGTVASPAPEPALEWCDVDVLRRIRRRSLAALRADVEPVDHPTYARFLLDWHGIEPRTHRHDRSPGTLSGVDGVAQVLDQLAGVPAPASAWETHILPARVTDYSSTLLDQLLATGEYTFSGVGSSAGNDGWVAFHTAETVDLTLRTAPSLPSLAPEQPKQPKQPEQPLPGSTVAQWVLATMQGTGGWFFPALTEQVRSVATAQQQPPPTDDQIVTALWELFWAGQVTNDTFAAVRGVLGQGRTAHRARPGKNRARTARPSHRGRISRLRSLERFPLSTDTGAETPSLSPTDQARSVGRWSLLPAPHPDPTVQAHADAEYLLERYGVITRGSVVAEELAGGFAQQYRLLTRMEEAGHVRRGYFIEHLGAAQFSTGATIDRLRGFVRTDITAEPAGPSRASRGVAAVALAATDPANPYGAALPWPTSETTGHRPGRKAGAVVVLVDGELILYLERGGRTVLLFGPEPSEETLTAVAAALVAGLQTARVDKLALQRVNGEPILGTTLATALLEAGFNSAPSGLRFRTLGGY